MTYTDLKSELADLRHRHIMMSGELRELDKALRPAAATDPLKLSQYKARAAELRPELEAIDASIAELEPRVTAGTQARKAEALSKKPDVAAALSRLTAALDDVARAADEVERMRAALREAGTGFKALPPLVLHGAKTLVDRAAAELERTR